MAVSTSSGNTYSIFLSGIGCAKPERTKSVNTAKRHFLIIIYDWAYSFPSSILARRFSLREESSMRIPLESKMVWGFRAVRVTDLCQI